MLRLSWDQVRAWRLERHHLASGAQARDIPTAVSAVGQIQAQILSAAEFAIGARVSGCTRDAVRQALWQDRSLIKTYGVRGTLHILAAGELAQWNASMRTRRYWEEPAWREGFGLTPRTEEELFAAIDDALSGECLTREELAGAVTSRIGPGFAERLNSTWGELLRPAAYLGLLCFGPNRGSKVTFVRPVDWIGKQPALDPGEALAEAVRRYLRAYGPATVRDLRRWFGASPDQARTLLGLVRDELAEVSVEGRRAWVLAADGAGHAWPEPDPFARGPSVRLLGQYEAYILGCGPKEQVLPDSSRPRIFAVGRGRYEGAAANQVMLVDGLVAGMWERRDRAAAIEVLVECLTDLDRPHQRALAAEVDRVAMFYGTDATLSFGQVGG